MRTRVALDPDVEALHGGTDATVFGVGSPRLLAVGPRRSGPTPG